MSTVTLQKENIKTENGVVVLPIKEYERLRANTVPVFYLSGREATKLDSLVEKGIENHKAGKTRKIKSLSDLD
jgi:hypothetical protein